MENVWRSIQINSKFANFMKMNLNLQATKLTPYVDFKPGKLELKGRSIHEDTTAFYQPLFEWLKEYSIHPEEKTEIDLQLEYVNSNSNKLILNLLKILAKKYSVNHDMIINWYYEEDDETILNLGRDFESLIEIPFNYIEIE